MRRVGIGSNNQLPRQGVALEYHRMTDAFRALAVGQLAMQPDTALFGEAQPSAVNWKEGSAFRHYLANLRSQARALRRSSYAETQTQYLQSVEQADRLLVFLRRQGVLAGDRAFDTDVSTAVRSALTQLESARGIQLENSWG